jgi:hypothetical protein
MADMAVPDLLEERAWLGHGLRFYTVNPVRRGSSIPNRLSFEARLRRAPQDEAIIG